MTSNMASWKIPPRNGGFLRKITFLNGKFSSKPYLIPGGHFFSFINTVPLHNVWLPKGESRWSVKSAFHRTTWSVFFDFWEVPSPSNLLFWPLSFGKISRLLEIQICQSWIYYYSTDHWSFKNDHKWSLFHFFLIDWLCTSLHGFDWKYETPTIYLWANHNSLQCTLFENTHTSSVFLAIRSTYISP